VRCHCRARGFYPRPSFLSPKCEINCLRARNKRYGRQFSDPARSVGGGHFSGSGGLRRGHKTRSQGAAHSAARLPSTAAPVQSRSDTIQFVGRCVCALSDSDLNSRCSWTSVYGAWAATIQRHYSPPVSKVASHEWKSLYGMWIYYSKLCELTMNSRSCCNRAQQ
jgi:hypothetical protein